MAETRESLQVRQEEKAFLKTNTYREPPHSFKWKCKWRLRILMGNSNKPVGQLSGKAFCACRENEYL